MKNAILSDLQISHTGDMEQPLPNQTHGCMVQLLDFIIQNLLPISQDHQLLHIAMMKTFGVMGNLETKVKKEIIQELVTVFAIIKFQNKHAHDHITKWVTSEVINQCLSGTLEIQRKYFPG